MENYIVELGNLTTYHCIQRGKKRIKTNKKKTYNLAKRALEYGLRYTALKSNTFLAHFLKSKTNDDAFAVAYNNYCFIFSQKTLSCLTVYEIPEYIQKKQYFDGKEHIKNYKKYCRYNFKEVLV